MMGAKIILPSILLILMCLIDKRSGLLCFQCNSGDHVDCEDPFDPVLAGKYLYSCPSYGKEYYCEKMVVNNYNGEREVRRSCQNFKKLSEYQEAVRISNSCFKTTVDQQNSLICKCELNGCNSGIPIEVNFFVILSAAVFAYLKD